MDAISKLVAEGVAINEAIRRTVEKSRRSWVFRHWESFKRDGFEALIDERLPREARDSRHGESLVEAARLANPNVTLEEVLKILEDQGVRSLPTEARIRRCFTRVDQRIKYAEKKAGLPKPKVTELPFAGGELLMAADIETRAIGTLTDVVEAMGAEAREASAGMTHSPDVARRDEMGHFTPAYNAQRRREEGEEIPSYLRTAEEKAVGRVPDWARFTHERRETLESKLRTITLAPLVCETKGWDALRSERASGLGPLTGFAYMPSTLAKLTSALAIAGAGPRLLEAVGLNWHGVAEGTWGEAGAVAALYVDNHAKEVWTSLFTMSGKVSRLSRVMPCITTTYVHTGAGTPMVVSVQSGSAPLAPRLLSLVEEVERKLDGDVRRAVVIDAEGSTFDILEAFVKQGRVIVTPLRPSRTPDLELTYTRGSYYRPYRERDELRVASAVLTHKSSGRELKLGALIVRRDHRKTDTVLLTTATTLGMEGRDAADLYYSRWPIQENSFKEGEVVDLAEHRGNCGRMVANIAVETELERLSRREAADGPKLAEIGAARAELEGIAAVARVEHRRASSALVTRRGRLDRLVEEGRDDGRMLGKAAIEHREAMVREELATKKLTKAERVLKAAAVKHEKLETALMKLGERRAALEPQRRIRELDVAQDSILTAMKLTLSLLITYVLREYLNSLAMSPATFASRIFGMSGRRELHADEERVVFYENPRDPAANLAVADACRRINERELRREGRRLRYSIEEREHKSQP